MKKKYEEFFYENDKNYPDSVYWNLYDSNRQEAMNKYDNHMYCPLCRMAPITVAKGNKLRYLKVDRTDTEKHAQDCSYRLPIGKKSEIDEFYSDLDRTDIQNLLVSCMNRMLKDVQVIKHIENKNGSNKMRRGNNLFSFVTSRKERKYLPHKNFNAGNLDNDLDIQKIFYGKCLMYIMPYIPNGESEIKKYYLKIYDQEKRKQIFDIGISLYVYKYIEKELIHFPQKLEEAKSYYLCVSSIMQKNGFFYTCNLVDSRLIVFEKMLYIDD